MGFLTLAIIISTVIVSFLAFQNHALFENFLFSSRQVKQEKEYYRLLTSMFVHGSWGHLLFNMLSFYFFASSVEGLHGPIILGAIYLAGGILGDVVALLIKGKWGDYRAVGASGGVMAVIFSSIFFFPEMEIYMFLIPIPIPAWLYAILFMAISFYGIGKGTDMIGHEAHLGGAATGILGAILVDPGVIAQSPVLFGALSLGLGAFAYVAIKWPEFLE